MERIHRGIFEDGLAAVGIGGTLTLIAVVARRYLPAKYKIDTLFVAAGGVSITALTFALLRSKSQRKQHQLARRIKRICVGGG